MTLFQKQLRYSSNKATTIYCQIDKILPLMPLRNNRIGIYRKYNAVITYRNVLPNIMRAIAPVLFVISLESLFFLNRVRPLRFLHYTRKSLLSSSER